MELEAWVWYWEHRLEDAKFEALRAADVYEKLGAAGSAENCRTLLTLASQLPLTPPQPLNIVQRPNEVSKPHQLRSRDPQPPR